MYELKTLEGSVVVHDRHEGGYVVSFDGGGHVTHTAIRHIDDNGHLIKGQKVNLEFVVFTDPHNMNHPQRLLGARLLDGTVYSDHISDHEKFLLTHGISLESAKYRLKHGKSIPAVPKTDKKEPVYQN